jgi:hypothetical protein
MSEPIFLKLGTYVYVNEPESISTANFINISHQSVCLYVYPLIVARQRLGRHVPAAMNTRNNRRIVGGIIFYTVRVVIKEILWVCMWTHVPAATKDFYRPRFL